MSDDVIGAASTFAPDLGGGGVVLDPPDVERMLVLKRQGWGTKRIAGELGVARGTVRRYLRMGRYEPYRREPPRRESWSRTWPGCGSGSRRWEETRGCCTENCGSEASRWATRRSRGR